MKSKVTTIANRLVGQGLTRSEAMRRAWILVKLGTVESKVVGVTHGKRQTALEHLTQYPTERVSVTLQRERTNAYDRNAIAVIARVEGRGAFVVGHLPRTLAAVIAPLMDAGKVVMSAYKAVVGKYREYMNYGLLIAVKI
jgi:hypothetical protein